MIQISHIHLMIKRLSPDRPSTFNYRNAVATPEKTG
jgi:hypothetical protein